MNARPLALGAGSAVTTFLLAGAMTIELLGAGEAPGIGILGVGVGVLVGLVAGGIVAASADRLSGIPASILIAYATFGIAFVAITGLRYVNVSGADDVFSFPVHVGASVVAAVAVALLAGHTGSRERSKTA